MRRRRAKKYIVGAYRPAYEEDTMTQTDFDKMMDNYLERRGSKPASGWAGQLLAQARSAGITDGSRPQSFATREEVVTMILNSGSGNGMCVFPGAVQFFCGGAGGVRPAGPDLLFGGDCSQT